MSIKDKLMMDDLSKMDMNQLSQMIINNPSML